MMKKLLVLLLLFLLISAKQSARQRDLKQRRTDCERTEACSMDSTENCVNRCLSAACYDKVYAKKPLEPGEVDKLRSNEFADCMKVEDRNRRNAKDDL